MDHQCTHRTIAIGAMSASKSDEYKIEQLFPARDLADLFHCRREMSVSQLAIRCDELKEMNFSICRNIYVTLFSLFSREWKQNKNNNSLRIRIESDYISNILCRKERSSRKINSNFDINQF